MVGEAIYPEGHIMYGCLYCTLSTTTGALLLLVMPHEIPAKKF